MMMTKMMALLTSRVGQLVLVGLVGLGVGAYTHKRFAPPTTTTTVVHDIQQVRVEVPVLTEKIVDHIITDPKQQAAVKLLLNENNELKLKITQISSTVATNESTGGTGSSTNAGTVTTNPIQGNSDLIRPANSHYEDYQLKADYSVSSFNYKLSQTFIIESSTGKGDGGQPVGITRLWQDTPTGLISVPAKTTVIQAMPNPSRWFISPRIQGGLNIDQTKVKAGFVGLQLIKHGTSKDPKDLKVAVGIVGLKLGVSTAEPTLIPFSFNVGSLPYQPLSNLWVGPSINANKKLGLVISATF